MNPMNTQIPDEEDEDIGISMDQYDQESEEDLMENSIDMDEYSKSKEAEQATWLDVGKDILMQPSLGALSAFTWGADLIKTAMVGESLSGLDELEDAYRKAGKEFDRDAYLSKIAESAEFIPTQDLLEKGFTHATGIETEPRSQTGKSIRQFFTILGLFRGKGAGKLLPKATKGLKSAATATTITGLAEAAGVPEPVARIGGDVAGGAFGSALKETAPRVLSKEAQDIEKTAVKHNLPFLEHQARETETAFAPRISQKRQKNLDRQLGESSDQAIEDIILDNSTVARLEKQGVDIEALDKNARVKLRERAANDKAVWSTESMVDDINLEINRIKSQAPSLSKGDRKKIQILEEELEELTIPGAKKGDPRQPKEMTSERAIKQHENYNKNMRGIYKKNELAGVEEDVIGAYQFLNQSTRSSLEKNASKEVSDTFVASNKIHNQVLNLRETQGLLSKTYENGSMNPKKLNKLLTSNKGARLRRTIGEDGVKELREIAEYSQKAQAATAQFAKSPSYRHQVAEWGVLAPLLLVAPKSLVGGLSIAKKIGERAQGILMTRPATRTIYANIMKNAAKGSFKAMKSDFAKLEDAIISEFGSIEDFMKSDEDDLQFFSNED